MAFLVGKAPEHLLRPWATGGIYSSGETPASTVLAAVAETVRDYHGPFLLGEMSADESV
jgi:hypothetical protein